MASDSLGRFRFLSPPFAGEEEETENGLDDVGAEVTTAEPGAKDEENVKAQATPTKTAAQAQSQVQASPAHALASSEVDLEIEDGDGSEIEIDEPTTTSQAQPQQLTSLQNSLTSKLSSAKFRWLNEQLYTTPSGKAWELMRGEGGRAFDDVSRRRCFR